MSEPTKADVNPQVRQKLDDISTRLMGDPSREDLETMQLHLDVLSRWDRLMMPTMARHDHDHMDDHDHEP